MNGGRALGILKKLQRLGSPAGTGSGVLTVRGVRLPEGPWGGALIWVCFDGNSGFGLQLYALLQRRSAIDSELMTAMQPITSFFAYRHPVPKAPGTPTKPQKKATAKAVKTLKKNAPQMLQGAAAGAQTQAATGTPASPAAAGATAPVAGGAAPAAPGNGAAATTGAGHS